MNKELFQSIISNLKEKPEEWRIEYGSAEREKPFVKIELNWNSVYVGGVSQTLGFFQKRTLRKAINKEAERRWTFRIRPGYGTIQNP